MVNRRPVVGGCVIAGLIGFASLLASCNPSAYNNAYSDGRTRLPDAFGTIQDTDLQPHFPDQTQAKPEAKGLKSASFFGHDEKPVATATEPAEGGAQKASDGEGYELNFENASVTTVAKVILGDILGAGYTIDPRVQGTVTLASGRPVPKDDLVFVLENALRMANTVLVKDKDGYRLLTAGDAQGNGAVRHAGDNIGGGYGVTAVPLRYASAQTIFKLLDSFAIKAGMARVEPAHNLIVVQGTGPERRNAVETILSFDVDWMRGQSVGIYPVQNTTPEEMIKELDKIMASGENGLNHNLVTLQPVNRLNAVLVVSRRDNLLRAAATWITRLDKSNSDSASVHVYRLRYGSAKQVASVLNGIFGTKQSNGLDSAVNQIAPGAGVATSTSNNQSGTGLPGSPSGGGLGGGGGGLGSTSGGGLGGGSGGLGSGSGGLGSSGGLGGGSGSGSALRAAVPGQTGAGGDNKDEATVISLPGVRITADEVNNAIVVFAGRENYHLIERTLAQLDQPQLQVAIHATIAEVTLNNDLQYGVQYYLQGKAIGGNFVNSASASAINSAGQSVVPTTTTGTVTNAISNAASTFINEVLPGSNLVIGSSNSPSVVLNALRAITDVKVLSSPSLVVTNNQSATLLVGDQVPVTTQSATSVLTAGAPVVNSVNYTDTGVILKVKPRINANGNVVLDIDQEISNVANNANASTLTPTLSQRKVKSQISVVSGQSVLLGGLISETQTRSRNGIPVLEELPLIGDAFANNERTTVRTELIIFIQPQIIRDAVDAYKVAEELRSKLRGSDEAAFPPGPSLRKDPRFVR